MAMVCYGFVKQQNYQGRLSTILIERIIKNESNVSIKYMCDNFDHMQPQKLAQKMKPACRGGTSNYVILL